MRCAFEPLGSLSWYRLSLMAATALVLAGCSSESSRFANDSLFSSRSAPPGEVTSSVPKRKTAIQSAPLPAPVASAPQTMPASAPQVAGSYNSPPPAPRQVSAPVPAPQKVAHAAPQPGWTWEGGTPVTVRPGDTAMSLSRQHGVPAAAILQSNNVPAGASLYPGQRLVIPRYAGSLTTGSVNAPRPVAAAKPPAPAVAAPQASAQSHTHTVSPGETLSSISRKYKVSLSAIARASNIPPHTMVKIGDQLTIPGVRAQTAAAAPAPAAQPAWPAQAQPKVAPPPQKSAAASPPVSTARTITPAADNPVPETKSVTASATPVFRWPVRGRVVSAFGPKTTGARNDGIDVAVPEGTPVKAAEDGVVAYAGNELKSYGNLVLIRHSNGYVTAYAHASEILVKRDQPIKRGQVIAKSGQTGGVNAPQLHFEIRKGSSPVDPMPYLDKGGNT
jgi:murein DD-endopeptidase MepM/ murein hydrolase activator NlpD